MSIFLVPARAAVLTSSITRTERIMLTAFLEARRFNAAITRYANVLPRQLRVDYGQSATYTPGQIEHAARRAGLPAAYLVIGYAMFLPETVFASLTAAPPGRGYAKIRAIAASRTRHPPPAVWSAAPENTEAFAGAGAVWPVL
jgi:hypothetical protein